MIVIAGAGSGKTRVLTYKIAYLMTEGVDPFNILALTFTNKAAKEMQIRVSKLLNKNATGLPWLGTFHSISAKILSVFVAFSAEFHNCFLFRCPPSSARHVVITFEKIF